MCVARRGNTCRVTHECASQDGSPGYFAQTLDNGIKIEATSTRRAGLERFTFPQQSSKPYFVLDLANDLPASFAGGRLDIDPEKGRITLGGRWGSRYIDTWFWGENPADMSVVASVQVFTTTRPSLVMISCAATRS